MWFLRHVEKFKLYFIRPYFKCYPEAQECKQNKCCEVLIVQYEWLHWDKTLTETDLRNILTIKYSITQY